MAVAFISLLLSNGACLEFGKEPSPRHQNPAVWVGVAHIHVQGDTDSDTTNQHWSISWRQVWRTVACSRPSYSWGAARGEEHENGREKHRTAPYFRSCCFVRCCCCFLTKKQARSEDCGYVWQINKKYQVKISWVTRSSCYFSARSPRRNRDSSNFCNFTTLHPERSSSSFL